MKMEHFRDNNTKVLINIHFYVCEPLFIFEKNIFLPHDFSK